MRCCQLFVLACCGRVLLGCASSPDPLIPDAGPGKDAAPRIDATDGPPRVADGEPSLPEYPPVRSGTRLKAKVYRAKDGTAFPFGALYDTQQAQLCAFARAGDGELRCLPLSATGDLRYSDAACSKEIVAVSVRKGCPAPTQVLLREGACAEQRARVHQLGKQLSLTAYYSRGTTGCQQLTVNPETRALHERGVEVPPATYVRGEERLFGGRNARFGVRVHQADEGAQERISYFDVARQVDCWVATVTSKALRCVPLTPCFMSSVYFADSGCDARLVGASGCADSCPAVIDYTDEACASFVEVFEVGAKLTTPRYSLSAGQCAASTTQSDSEYFALGAALPETEFLEVTTTVEPTGSRLARRWLLFGDQGRAQDDRAHDRARDELCAFTRATDGTIRCMPSSGPHVGTATRFADSRCTRRMARVYEDGCKPLLYLRHTEAAGCESRTRLYLAGDTVQRDTYYTQSSTGECTLHDDAGEYVLAGVELSPAQFVEVAEELE